MARPQRQVPRPYTHEEKVAFVTEVERRYRAGGDQTLSAIARALGVPLSNYYNWVNAGIKARRDEPEKQARAATPGPRSEEERARLVAEVDALRTAGRGLKAACRQVRIAEESYRSWRRPPAVPALRPVEILDLVPVVAPTKVTVATHGPGAAPLALVAPGGYRIEGLDVASAASLLRALA